MTNWITSYADDSFVPSRYDTTSSKSVVYERRNFRQEEEEREIEVEEEIVVEDELLEGEENLEETDEEVLEGEEGEEEASEKPAPVKEYRTVIKTIKVPYWVFEERKIPRKEWDALNSPVTQMLMQNISDLQADMLALM